MEVKGYPNYLIFRNGAVLSKKSKTFLKPNDNGNGYYHVNLYNPKRKMCKIHRLVAEHYIPNPHNYQQVDHINRIRTDNRLSNLRWVTRAENSQNKGNYKTNTSGHKNISFNKKNNHWRFRKEKHGKRFDKYFKTFEEAIEFKLTGKFDYL